MASVSEMIDVLSNGHGEDDEDYKWAVRSLHLDTDDGDYQLVLLMLKHMQPSAYANLCSMMRRQEHEVLDRFNRLRL